MVERKEVIEVDKGYAFVVLIGSTVMYMLVIGGAKAYGLLYTEMLKNFQAGSGHTGLVGGICVAVLLALGATSNILSKKYTFRKVTFIGGLIAGAGHIATAFVPSVDYVILTYGVIVGTGFGLVLLPSVTIISYYFVKHRYLANSTTVAWSGIWAIVVSFLYDFLIDKYGFRGTMLIVGGITLNISAAACTFIQPKEFRRSSQGKAVADTNLSRENQNVANKEKTYKYVDFYVEFKNQFVHFRNPSFLVCVVYFMLYMFAYSNSVILITASARELGLRKTDEAINVAIMGGCDAVTRLALGWFTDKKLIQTRFIYALNMAIGALFSFLYPFFKTLYFLRIYSAATGVFIASCMALVPPLLIETFGMADYPQQIGLMYSCSAITFFASQPLIGWTEDISDNWDIAYILTGVSLAAGLVILLLEPVFSRLFKPKPQDNNPVSSDVEYVTKL